MRLLRVSVIRVMLGIGADMRCIAVGRMRRVMRADMRPAMRESAHLRRHQGERGEQCGKNAGAEKVALHGLAL